MTWRWIDRRALELLHDVGDLDALLTPVGGGGLLSGCALVAKTLRPDIAVSSAAVTVRASWTAAPSEALADAEI